MAPATQRICSVLRQNLGEALLTITPISGSLGHQSLQSQKPLYFCNSKVIVITALHLYNAL